MKKMISIGREYKKNKKKGNDKSLPKKNHFFNSRLYSLY